MRLGKFKLSHYINYIVIGVMTLVLGGMTLAGTRFDNSLLFLLEKMSIGIILAESMKYLSAGLWWPAVFPGLVLLMIVLLVEKLGDNLRMILDPYSAQE